MKKLLYILLFVPLALFGQENYSLNFDGSNNFIEINHHASLVLSNLSISFWMKTSNTNSGIKSLIAKENFSNDDVNGEWWVYMNHASQNKINFYVIENNTQGGVTHSSFLNDNIWHFVSITRNGDTGEQIISVDGQNPIFSYGPSGILSEPVSLFIGGGNNYNYNGLIDNVAIWNTILTPEELALHMHCPLTGQEEGLVGYWNFNEGSGNTVYDISGYGNDGTINGAQFSEDVPEQNCFIEELSNLTDIDGFSYGGFYDSSYYFVSQELAFWEEANTICNSSGGYLASITSEEENDFISSLLNLELEDGWIGLTDSLIEGDWVWSNGELYEYNNWANNEPGGTDGSSDENHGLIHINGTWNDGYELTYHQFIMEIDAIYGCLNPDYYNYNPQANTSDDSCVMYQEFIIDSLQQALAVFETVEEEQEYSMSFDGVDDHIVNNSINPGSSSFTFQGNIYFDQDIFQTDYEMILQKGIVNIGHSGFTLRYDSDFDTNPKIRASIFYTNSEAINLISNDSIETNKWYNISMTIDRENNLFSLYLDAELVDQQEIGSNPNFQDLTNNFPLDIGRHYWMSDSGHYYNGRMNEFGFWNVALSQEQIQSYMSCPPTGQEEGLVGYWNFNEGSGDTVYDLSGNGNHGVIYGAEFSQDVPESYNGCTDELALNYDESALCDNGSCVYGDELVSNLGEDLGIANDSIFSLETDLELLEESLLNANDSIDILSSDLSLANDSISSLELEISVIQSDISLLEFQLDSTTNQLTQIQSDLEASINDINILSDSIASLNNLITSLHQDLSIAMANQEDGISQADVDSAYNEGTSIGEEYGYSQGYNEGYNQGNEDGESYGYTNGFEEGVASIIPEDGINQADVDAVQILLDEANSTISNLNSSLNTTNSTIAELEEDLLVAMSNQEDGISQADVDAVQILLDEANNLTFELNNSLALANLNITELEEQLSACLENQTQVISIDLIEGWNIIGYTLYEPQDAAASFVDITNEVQLVKNNTADVYWPEFGFNGIGDLIPGQGYQVRVTSNILNFTYPNVGGQRIELVPTVPQWVIDMEVDIHPNDIRTLVKVVNMLGQEVDPETEPKGTVLIYLYNDASVEKKIVK